MIHPSYVELMKVINENVEEGEEPVVNSRYSVVCATAKRARQIIDGSEPLIRVKNKDKALSVAVEEPTDRFAIRMGNAGGAFHDEACNFA
jgi:DNA-directed RNA polymerase subunit omega